MFFSPESKPKLETQKFPEFFKYILKNYRVSTESTIVCQLNYASIVLTVDKSNKIVDCQVKGKVAADIKNTLSFIKGYQFPETSKIQEKPILFFITFDTQEICPPIHSSDLSTTTLLKETFRRIEEQLTREPQTIVLYDVVPIKIFKPRHKIKAH